MTTHRHRIPTVVAVLAVAFAAATNGALGERQPRRLCLSRAHPARLWTGRPAGRFGFIRQADGKRRHRP